MCNNGPTCCDLGIDSCLSFPRSYGTCLHERTACSWLFSHFSTLWTRVSHSLIASDRYSGHTRLHSFCVSRVSQGPQKFLKPWIWCEPSSWWLMPRKNQQKSKIKLMNGPKVNSMQHFSTLLLLFDAKFLWLTTKTFPFSPFVLLMLRILHPN